MQHSGKPIPRKTFSIFHGKSFLPSPIEMILHGIAEKLVDFFQFSLRKSDRTKHGILNATEKHFHFRCIFYGKAATQTCPKSFSSSSTLIGMYLGGSLSWVATTNDSSSLDKIIFFHLFLIIYYSYCRNPFYLQCC